VQIVVDLIARLPSDIAKTNTEIRVNDTAARRRPLILLAEDDDALRAAVAEELIAAGYDVVTAADGAAAIGVIHSHGPAVVIIDLLMPRKTGWQVWDELQLHPRLRQTPVIIFTGTGLTNGALGRAPVVAKSAGGVVTLLRHVENALTTAPQS
jgi:CheY-like chemotaxis protein